MRWLHLFIHVLLLTHLSSGQDPTLPGSGSGEDLVMPDDNPQKTLVDLFCSSYPDFCQQSSLVCPCGSVYDILLNGPNNFYMLQLFPCAAVHKEVATFRECDAFIEYGASLAVNSILSYKELEYLYLYCFTIITTVNQPDDIVNSVHSFMDLIERDQNVFGILGPNDPDVLEILPYVAGNVFQKLIISYSTSIEMAQNPDKYRYLYSTVPSPSFFTKVILQLLSDFGWRKVAIISTRDPIHLRNSEYLLELASMNSSFEFSFANAYDDDPSPLLEQFQKDNFRIFVANVESSKARDLFCTAKMLNLTTERHQWILPSFYDHKWWEANCTEQDCLCTNDQILDASLSTIFVGESNTEYGNSTRMKTAFQILEGIYKYTLDSGIDTTVVDIFPDDELFLLHSKALYVYDAVNLLAIVFNDAMRELFNTTQTDQEREYLCDAVKSSNQPFTSNVLITKILEILDRSIFCGYSGYYVLANSSSFGQAWITQFQYYENCLNGTDLGNFKDGETRGCYKESDIGHYSNINQPNECEYFELKNVNELDEFPLSEIFHFTNSCFEESDRKIISSQPYLWKGDNPWQPPVDGACRDDSCVCLNQLGLDEIIVGIVMTSIGIILCCALLLINCQLRNNKHIKASSPRFNSIIIIGCLMLYLVPVFNAVSLSGNHFDMQKLIPSSCEVTKWLQEIGFTIIMATMVARNWRIYRIFFNPKIEERKFLSDRSMFILTIILVLPVLLTVFLWTLFDGFEYSEIRELYPCPGLDVNNSVTTYRLSIRCIADHFTVLESSIIIYQALLGTLLLFLGCQNSTILSHFAEEGEFASKSMFTITLFAIPLFLIEVTINETTSLDSVLVFWTSSTYIAFFPTILLLGLYIPKFILILKDKQNTAKERRTTRVQWSLQLEYESKVNEIDDLKTRLRLKQDDSFELNSYAFGTISQPSSPGIVRFSDIKKSPSPSPLTLYRQKQFFDNNT